MFRKEFFVRFNSPLLVRLAVRQSHAISRNGASPQLSTSKRPLFQINFPLVLTTQRTMFGWLNSIFNRYDDARVKEVGPDRACAEWCLRCGAAVRWKNAENFLKDYNSLPVGVSREQKIVEIDATDSAVMEAGFLHLCNLTELKRIKFKNCRYLTDESLAFLDVAMGDKLEIMEISFNGNLTDNGLRRLAYFKQLKILHLEELEGVDKPKDLLEYLQSELPDCKISFPPLTSPVAVHD